MAVHDDLITIPPLVPGLLGQAGVDFAALIRGTGAPMPAKGDRLRLSTAQFFSLWRAVALAVPADFGLQIPMLVPSHQFDVASTAALHSENFGEALSKLARYKRLTCPEDISVAIDGDEAQVHFIWLRAGAEVPSLIIDGAFAWLYRLAELGAGKLIKPVRIEVTRTETNKAALFKYFGCPVRFNAPRDLLVFEKTALDTPFISHHPEMLNLMIPGLESALQARSASASSTLFTQQVRSILLKGMRGKRPSIDHVAKQLCVSPRTLQRRLEDESTTYQQLLDDVRLQTARHLLSTTDLETGEIAFVLGFEELNSFARAFQGWEGTSPNRWRSIQRSVQ